MVILVDLFIKLYLFLEEKGIRKLRKMLNLICKLMFKSVILWGGFVGLFFLLRKTLIIFFEL